MRRGLQPVMEGARIARVETRRPDLRFPLPERFAERLEGRTITALGRRAKYLTAHIDGGPALICHLGMSGSFRVEAEADSHTPGAFHHDRSKASAHDHVVFHLEAPRRRVRRAWSSTIRGASASCCLPRAPPTTIRCLPDSASSLPATRSTGGCSRNLFRGRKSPLKAALLDQRLIAGLGNIYVAEALWRAGLSPLRAAGTIAERGKKAAARAEALADAVRSVIADAIQAGGSSLRDYIQADGSLGYFQHSFSVYDREGEPCPTPGCNGHISRIVQSGRSTFYCPSCQR